MKQAMSGRGPGTVAPAIAVAVLAGVAVLGGCAAAGPAAKTVPSGQRTHANAPALPHASCGGAVTHGLSAGTQILSADKGALSCFRVAARDCRTASIAVTEMGVDTGTNHVFVIKPGGKGCAVTDVSQYYSANFGGSHGKVASTRCSVAAIGDGGVTLACDGAKVLIPATVTRL